MRAFLVAFQSWEGYADAVAEGKYEKEIVVAQQN